MAENIANFFLGPIAPSIQFVFVTQAPLPSFRGKHSVEALKTPHVGKFAIFDLNRPLSLKWYEICPCSLWNVDRKSQVADRSVSVPMTLSDLESRDSRCQNFQVTLVPFDLERPNSAR